MIFWRGTGLGTSDLVMKMTRDLQPIIASRVLIKGDREVRVDIGQPRKEADQSDYLCPYRIAGIGDERIRYAVGIDAVQALLLTMKKIGADLYTSAEMRGRDLVWVGGSEPGDLGFPVPDVLRDLAPGEGKY